MTSLEKVSPELLLPSQDFLNPQILSFAYKSLEAGNVDLSQSPFITPVVQAHDSDTFIARNSHNLIAASLQLGRDVLVHITTEQDEAVTTDFEHTRARGISGFADLLRRYEVVIFNLQNTPPSYISPASERVMHGPYPDIPEDLLEHYTATALESGGEPLSEQTIGKLRSNWQYDQHGEAILDAAIYGHISELEYKTLIKRAEHWWLNANLVENPGYVKGLINGRRPLSTPRHSGLY